MAERNTKPKADSRFKGLSNLKNKSRSGDKNKNPKIVNRKTIIMAVSFALLCFVGIGIIFSVAYNKKYDEMKSIVDVDTIYNNVYVDNVNLGGLTKEQAIALLEEKVLPTIQDRTVILTCNADTFTFKYADFGANYDFQKSVDLAYNYARNGSIQKRYKLIMELNNQGWYTESDYSYDYDKIVEAVKSLEDKVYQAPVNASIEKKDGQFVTIPGKVGYKLNVNSTAAAVEETVKFKNGGSMEAGVIMALDEIQPEYQEDSFEGATDLIGEADSRYSGGDSARTQNVKNASSKLNGTVIYPNEVFSTNACFGEMSAANGYASAGTIVKGKLVDDYGGGVCQVSSTLYNAVLYSECEVVERQNHSLKVGYEDYGFDATLAGDYIDFKFKNTTEKPIYIEAYLTSNKVVCRIYGQEIHDASRKLKFENELVETIEPGADVITYDSSLPEGTKQTTVSALKGYKYKVYKLVYENGELKEKTLVNNSYYKPRAAEVTVGTKKAEPETVETTEQTETVQSEPTTVPTTTATTVTTASE